MRATIKNYLEAAERRREEEGEKGFSLIELIIVVVILGILVAIAVPIFVNIQDQAAKNAVAAAAANGATAAAAAAADPDNTTVTPEAAAASAGSNGITVELMSGGGTTPNVSLICVEASDGTNTAWAGPNAVVPSSGGTPTGCN